VIKKLIKIFTILSISLILISWGGTGHRKISENSSLSYNTEMSQFYSWVTYLADHASDADIRKQWDNTESPKHYIDIDNYSEFIATGTIPQNIVAAISAHNYSFVYGNGILPWATIASFDSLRNCFIRRDWEKAKQFAADLGHYVADGHMPLHITDNYDGQNTGNDGIHSRYESTMINTYSSQINYSGESISVVSNVNQYVFNYIYNNYKYVDSVLIADNYAKTFGSTSTTEYKQALWNKTKGFTTKLFKNGSHTIAELIYTAWVQAGSPSFTTSNEQIYNTTYSEILEQNSPNPFSTFTKIKFNLNENADVVLEVRDIIGNRVATLVKDHKTAGSHSIDWFPENLQHGIYFIVLDTKKIHQVKKMILIK